MNKTTAREIINGNYIYIFSSLMRSEDSGESVKVKKAVYGFHYDPDKDVALVNEAYYVIEDQVIDMIFPRTLSLEDFGEILENCLKNKQARGLGSDYYTKTSVRIREDDH